MLCLIIIPSYAESQNADTSIAIESGTSLSTSIIKIIANYAEDLNDAQIYLTGKNNSLYFSPQFKFSYGQDNEAKSIIAKATGYWAFYKTITPAGGIETIDTTKVINSIPFSIGLESDGLFEQPIGLAEFGYVPWYRGAVPSILKKSQIGIFIQTGYKFKIADTNNTANIYETKETIDSLVLRAKVLYGIEIDPEMFNGRIGLSSDGSLVYDLANNSIYYQINGIVRFNLPNNKRFDLKYEKGTGAPYYNTGDNFSANLTFMF
jgi:hypothetical protein